MKIYKKGNYLVLDNGSEEVRIPTRNVSHIRKVVGAKTYYNFPEVGTSYIDAATITDAAGAAYADFDTFITSNTGA